MLRGRSQSTSVFESTRPEVTAQLVQRVLTRILEIQSAGSLHDMFCCRISSTACMHCEVQPGVPLCAAGDTQPALHCARDDPGPWTTQ
jgi:hypothetical protein